MGGVWVLWVVWAGMSGVWVVKGTVGGEMDAVWAVCVCVGERYQKDRFHTLGIQILISDLHKQQWMWLLKY